MLRTNELWFEVVNNEVTAFSPVILNKPLFSLQGLLKPKHHKRTRMSKSTLKKVKNEELQLPDKEIIAAT